MAHHAVNDKATKKFRKLLEFAKIWNDVRSYPANYDLERRLGKKIAAIQARAREYRKYRIAHPLLGLPALVLRRIVTGGIIAVPYGVLEQLDPFRIDIEKIKNAKAIVVTGQQFGANLNKSFWSSLMQYEKERGALVVVMPIKYGPVKTVHQKETGARYLTSTFPEEMNGRVLFEDLELCGGELMLNVTRMRPTLERFLTDTICEMGGTASQIFAAPKLELEHRPRVGHHYPKAIMTTGACNYPNYHVDNLGQQDRTGEIATEAHNFAAIVVELDHHSFHFRQLHANKRGEFYDINPRRGGADFFTPRGAEHRPDDVSALLCGDWHTGKTDPQVRAGTFGRGSMTQTLKPKMVVLHDFIDCDSVSEWEQKTASRRAYKAPLQWDSLENELYAGKAEFEWMRSQTDAELIAVASNHPEFVTDFIESLRWTKDNRNLEIGARLLLGMVDDLKSRTPQKHEAKATDPIVAWFRKNCPDVTMLERQDALLLPRGAEHPILVSMHGDKGPRGSETRSTKAFRQMNQRTFLAHNHSGTIHGPVWRLGTSTPRMQFYITSPATNWTNTHGIIFKNSQRQLLNFVKGRWYGKRQWKNAA
jgi:hypothetical protein